MYAFSVTQVSLHEVELDSLVVSAVDYTVYY